jgi:hypothetical protein
VVSYTGEVGMESSFERSRLGTHDHTKEWRPVHLHLSSETL